LNGLPESKQLNNQLAVNSVLEVPEGGLGRRLDRALADCQVSSKNQSHNVNNQTLFQFFALSQTVGCSP
jgi:hypothetical protein